MSQRQECDGCDQVRECQPFQVQRYFISLCAECRAEQNGRNGQALAKSLDAVYYGKQEPRLDMDDAAEAAARVGRRPDRKGTP